MNKEIAEKINLVRHGGIPNGYKRIKNRIVPEDWCFTSIGELVKKIGNKIEVDPNKEYQEIGIRSHGKGIFHKEPVLGKRLGEKSVYWIEPNCLILNIVFAWEQAIARTTQNEEGMIGSHRFPMYKPLPDKLDLDFLLYFFKTKLGKNLLELASPGGAGRNKTLGQKEFQNIELFLPQNVNEQKKISDILLTLDKKIELKEKQLELKQKYKKELMERILTGKLRFKGFNDSWDNVQLVEILKESKIVSKENDLNKRITVRLNLNGVQKRGIKGTEVEEGTMMYERKAGQFIYGKQNLFKGAFGIVPTELDGYLSSSDIPSFDISDNIEKYFLFYSIARENFYTSLEKISTGTGSKRINPKEFLKLNIQVPKSRLEQKKIVEVISTIDRECKLRDAELGSLKQEKNTLTMLLLTGIVRVKCD